MGSSILKGERPDGGVLFAGVSAEARFVAPEVSTLRFAAILNPFHDEAAARAALEAAGATNIKGGSK